MREELDGLRDLEDRYKRVVEENRTLYNTVQDLRGNIRVFCRSASCRQGNTGLQRCNMGSVALYGGFSAAPAPGWQLCRPICNRTCLPGVFAFSLNNCMLVLAGSALLALQAT